MTLETRNGSWDFTPVIDLINALSLKQLVSKQEEEHAAEQSRRKVNGEVQQQSNENTSLGDFSKIWDFLGVSKAADPSTPASVDPAIFVRPFDSFEYASDGAIYTPAPLKGVRWKDDVDGTSLEETAEETASPDDNGSVEDVTESTPNASKAKKKKLKKKNKKSKKNAEQLENGLPENAGIEPGKSVSDVEFQAEPQGSKDAPARKASLHALASDNVPAEAHRYNLRSRSVPSIPKPMPHNVIHPLAPPAAVLGNKPNGLQTRNAPPSSAKPAERKESLAKLAQAAAFPLTPQPPRHSQSVASKGDLGNMVPIPATCLPRETPQNRHPLSNPYSQPFSHFVPHPNIQITQPPFAIANNQQPQNASKMKKPPPVIQPLIPRSIVDRNLALFNKLFAQFPDDRAWLVSPMTLSNHSTSPTGIHVFVDFSNIVIGFMEQLKKQRGISRFAHLPQVNISFHALVLMMERRRPVAKRVLAGSTPYIAAFDEAKEIGYETNILDKVLKAKELTERQIYFRELDKRLSKRKRKSTQNNNTSNSATPTKIVQSYGYTSILPGPDSSGSSDSNCNGSTPQNNGKVIAPEKWVEQAVDEILHLKMMESLVDYAQPSTMVLATGDAAEAEYSKGFLAMAERALKKGWRVELIAWGRTVSLAWRKLEWSIWKKQGQEQGSDGVVEFAQAERQFRIIELDDFAEELLNM